VRTYLDRRTGHQRRETPTRGYEASARPRLFERDEFFAELRALLSTEWDRPSGPIVVEGRCGLGKTAFVGAAGQMAREAGLAVLQARAESLGDQVLGTIAERLLYSHVPEAPASQAAAGQPAAVGQLERLVRSLAADRGVLVAIDDAHLLDDDAVSWLRSLEGGPAHRRIRVLLSVAERLPQSPLRPVEAMLSAPHARVMSLTPLSTDGVSALVADCLRSYWSMPSDPSFVHACREATGGIPLFLISLLRELRSARVEPTATGARRVERATSPTIARWVLGKMSLLPEDAGRVLDALAVVGTPGDSDTVAKMTKLSVARVRSVTHLLTAADLLVRDDTRLAFVPLVRRTVYEEIDPALRAKLHLRAATHLHNRGTNPAEVVEHLLLTEPGHRQWVAQELARAGRAALQAGAVSEAVRYLRRYLAENPGSSQPYDVRLELVRAEAAVDERAAVEHLGDAVRGGASPDLAAGVAVSLTRIVTDVDVKAKLAGTLDEIAARLSRSDLTSRTELHIANALLAGPPGALVVAERLRSEMAEFPTGTLTERKAVALLAIADTVDPSRRPASEVADALRRALDEDQLASGDRVDSELWGRAVLALARSGGFEPADALARHAQAQARAGGFRAAEAEFLLTLAISLSMQGALRDAEAEARNALSLVHGEPWSRRPEAAACLAGVLLDQGRVDEVEEVLGQFAGLEIQPSAFEALSLLEQRARLRAHESRTAEALSDFLLAGQRAEALGVSSPAVTLWRSETALLLSREGRSAEATRVAGENLDLARAHGERWLIGAATRVVALVGPAGERVDRLEEAVELLEHGPAQLQLAQALADLGCALRANETSSSRARSVLRRAADIAFRHGATPLATRSATELRLSGARPRRLALWGPGALTSSERRIVELATAGLTNAEIAEELFVSEKTIEGHLVRAYRKLGVRSRRELKERLRPAREGSSGHIVER
jgi:DNA-binding CsgD family transcriptional regulator